MLDPHEAVQRSGEFAPLPWVDSHDVVSAAGGAGGNRDCHALQMPQVDAHLIKESSCKTMVVAKLGQVLIVICTTAVHATGSVEHGGFVLRAAAVYAPPCWRRLPRSRKAVGEQIIGANAQ
jgi:hypothetical protein